MGNRDHIKNGIKFLEERGWSELVDPRWTIDLYNDLKESGLGLSDTEIHEICNIVCLPEPDWNTMERLNLPEDLKLSELDRVFNSIKYNGFDSNTLQLIDNYSNKIQNGQTNNVRFNTAEHAGLCGAGKVLNGACAVASYARRSLGSGEDAGGSQTAGIGASTGPNTWEIDEAQEKFVEEWAKACGLWFYDFEQIINDAYGPPIAVGAEAKVYYRDGDTSVIKLRTSIYSVLQKAFDAIILHNALFPESLMKVVGFTRDEEGLFRTILTQPFVKCKRLATENEIEEYVASKGFRRNTEGFTESFVTDRILLEDMHPANVFIDEQTGKPICIDCIVKFHLQEK